MGEIRALQARMLTRYYMDIHDSMQRAAALYGVGMRGAMVTPVSKRNPSLRTDATTEYRGEHEPEGLLDEALDRSTLSGDALKQLRSKPANFQTAHQEAGGGRHESANTPSVKPNCACCGGTYMPSASIRSFMPSDTGYLLMSTAE